MGYVRHEVASDPFQPANLGNIEKDDDRTPTLD